MRERERLRGREALHGALLAFCSNAAATDIVANIVQPLEDGDPVHETLRTSVALAKHVAEEDRDEAVAIAGNAYLRATGAPKRALRMTNLQRFVLAIGSGVDPAAAARATTGEDH